MIRQWPLGIWKTFERVSKKQKKEKGVLHVVGTTLIGFIFFFSMFGWWVWYVKKLLLTFFVINNVCTKISRKVVCCLVDKIRTLLFIAPDHQDKKNKIIFIRDIHLYIGQIFNLVRKIASSLLFMKVVNVNYL